MIDNYEWIKCHSSECQKESKQSLATVKSTHYKKTKGDDNLSAPPLEKEIPDKSSCEARSKSGKSELLPHEEYTKCNSEAQKKKPKA